MSTKYFIGAALGLLAAMAMGCGAPSAEDVVTTEGIQESSQELSTCTATCASGSVSCPGGTTLCSAQDNHGVTCNGTFIACPTTPPACAGLLSCEELRGSACLFPNEEPCCFASGQRGECSCSFGGIWRCNGI